MADAQLRAYILQERQRGVGDDGIRSALLQNGWQQSDIDSAFVEINSGQVATVGTGGPLPSAPALLGEAWQLYKKRIRTLLAVFALTFVGSLLNTLPIEESGAYIGTGPALILSSLFSVVGVVLSIIGGIWGTIALIYVIKDPGSIGFKEAYRKSWGMARHYYWVAAYVGFIGIGGFFLLIVPGVIFSVWFTFAALLVITEDLRGMDALLKSKAYVMGQWGSVLWRTFFLGLIYLLVLIPISILGYLVNPIVGSLLILVSALVFTPLSLTYLYVLYTHVRNRRPDVNVPTKGRRGLIAIGVFGLLAIIAIPILVIATLASLYSLADYPTGSFSSETSESLSDETGSIFSDLVLESSRIKSRDAKRVSDAKQIQTVLELYSSGQAVLSFPVVPSSIVVRGCLADGGFTSTCPASDDPRDFPYMREIPENPEPGGTPYTYASTDENGLACAQAPCAGYTLSFTLEEGVGRYPAGLNVFTQSSSF